MWAAVAEANTDVGGKLLSNRSRTVPSAPAAQDPPGEQGRTDARQSERHRLRHHHKLRDLPRDIPCRKLADCGTTERLTDNAGSNAPSRE